MRIVKIGHHVLVALRQRRRCHLGGGVDGRRRVKRVEGPVGIDVVHELVNVAVPRLRVLAAEIRRHWRKEGEEGANETRRPTTTCTRMEFSFGTKAKS